MYRSKMREKRRRKATLGDTWRHDERIAGDSHFRKSLLIRLLQSELGKTSESDKRRESRRNRFRGFSPAEGPNKLDLQSGHALRVVPQRLSFSSPLTAPVKHNARKLSTAMVEGRYYIMPWAQMRHYKWNWSFIVREGTFAPHHGCPPLQIAGNRRGFETPAGHPVLNEFQKNLLSTCGCPGRDGDADGRNPAPFVAMPARFCGVSRADSRARGRGMTRSRPAASISKVFFQIVGKALDFAPLHFRRQRPIHSFLKPPKFGWRRAVFPPGIIIGSNGYGTQRNDLVARHNADVLAAFGLFQQGGKIRASLGNS